MSGSIVEETYLDAVDTIGQLSLLRRVFWSQFLVIVLVVNVVHLANDLVLVIIVVVLAILGNVAVALLACFSASGGLLVFVTKGREPDGPPLLQRTELGEVELAGPTFGTTLRGVAFR